jgi:hypothetical protein
MNLAAAAVTLKQLFKYKDSSTRTGIERVQQRCNDGSTLYE